MTRDADEPRPPFDPFRVPRDPAAPPPRAPAARGPRRKAPRAAIPTDLFGGDASPPAGGGPPVAGAPQQGGAAAKSPPLSVTQLNRLVKSAIVSSLPSTVVVVGELSNVARPAGGHLYFTLKDAGSEVRCVMWRSDAAALKFELKDGQEVVATGSVDVYEPRGQYQLYVRRMEPRGVGALELAFQQLRDKLAREGLFDPGRKRPLPRLPGTVAVVTSLTGAAVRDILQTIERRFPRVRVLLFGVRVQGEGAAAEIADAIRRINASREALGGVDVMIVGRGGGSLEDLWAFNEEAVARAIYGSEIPVVSAVGHEVDFTIADFVADVRAATPTAAAELVVPVLGDVLAALDAAQRRLAQAMRREVQLARQRIESTARAPWYRDPLGLLRRRSLALDDVSGRLRLDLTRLLSRLWTRVQSAELALARNRPEVQIARRLARAAAAEQKLSRAAMLRVQRFERRLAEAAGHLAAASPAGQVERARLSLDHAAGRIDRAIVETLSRDRRQVEHVATRLDAASHERVLGRGFTITRRMRGRALVTRRGDVTPGDRIQTQTADGSFTSRVDDERQGELFDA